MVSCTMSKSTCSRRNTSSHMCRRSVRIADSVGVHAGSAPRRLARRANSSPLSDCDRHIAAFACRVPPRLSGPFTDRSTPRSERWRSDARTRRNELKPPPSRGAQFVRELPASVRTSHRLKPPAAPWRFRHLPTGPPVAIDAVDADVGTIARPRTRWCPLQLLGRGHHLHDSQARDPRSTYRPFALSVVLSDTTDLCRTARGGWPLQPPSTGVVSGRSPRSTERSGRSSRSR
jgi:hypothetical protein